MISFFRKIRQKLLNENRVTRYLAYAVGEIILVTIGILIALQINTWNEERKLRKEEATLIQNLHEEFEQNLNKLESIISQNEISKNSQELILQWISNSPENLREESLDTLISKSIQAPISIPSSFVLEDIKNTGGLSKIKNEELKYKLYEWEREIADLANSKNLYSSSLKDFGDYLVLKGSMRNVDSASPFYGTTKSTLPITNLSLIKDPVFENYVDNCHVLAKEYVRALIRINNLMINIYDLTKK